MANYVNKFYQRQRRLLPNRIYEIAANTDAKLDGQSFFVADTDWH
jgi:hypothetical protein